MQDTALNRLVDQLTEAEARRLLSDVYGRAARRSSGIRVLVVVDALRACAADAVWPSSPREYTRWRSEQPSPAELPSARLILRCFEERWSAALEVAELPRSAGRRVQQRNPSSGGYSAAELTDALGTWLEKTGGEDVTFRAYATWAQTRTDSAADGHVPLSAPTFRGAFGSWQRAVEIATGDSQRSRRGRDVRSNYTDQQLCAFVVGAATSTGAGGRLTRREYDEWAASVVTDRGVRPAHSETIRRRFGGWRLALVGVGLS